MTLTPRFYKLASLPAIAGGLFLSLTSPIMAVVMFTLAGLFLFRRLLERNTV